MKKLNLTSLVAGCFLVPAVVFAAPGDNIALTGTAAHSSECCGGSPSRAIDGNINGHWSDGSTTHTDAEVNPKWWVTLKDAKAINRITFSGRTDCCPERNLDLIITIRDANDVELWRQEVPGLPGGFPLGLNVQPAVTGNIVRVERISTDLDAEGNPKKTWLSIAEVQVFEADPADTTLPTLISAGSVDGSSVGVEFSEFVDQATAETTANYNIGGGAGVGIAAASLRPDGKTVELSGVSVAGSYTVTVSGVKDLAGNAAASSSASGNVLGLSLSEVLGDASASGPSSAISSSNGEIEITAGGGDIWGKSDDFAFASTPTSGDFDVQVKLVQVEQFNEWARHSLMVRESLDADSKHVSVGQRGLMNGGVNYSHIRSTTGGDSGYFNPGPQPGGSAKWFRLKRLGSDFVAFRSADGATWEYYGNARIGEFDGNSYVGLAVSRGAKVGPIADILPMGWAKWSNYGAFGGASASAFAITQQPANILTAQNRSASFSVAASVPSIGAVELPATSLSYQWQIDAVDIDGATSSSYNIAVTPLSDNGKKVRCVVSMPGLSIASSEATLSVSADTTAPTVVSHGAITGNISIAFDELMGASAAVAANYQFGGAAVASAALLIDGKTVVLGVAGLGASYSLQVLASVTDLAGNPIVPVTLTGETITGFNLNSIGVNATGDAYSPDGNIIGLRSTGGLKKANNDGDDMQFLGGLTTGDFDKVIKITDIAADSRGGLMARESLDAASRVVKLVADGDAVEMWNRIAKVWDQSAPTPYDRQGGIGGLKNVLPNQWIRLKRTGSSFHAFVRDGSRPWAQVFSKNSIGLPAELYVGFFAAGNKPEAAASVQFSNYGDYVPAGDTTSPWLVSGGSWDKKRVGLKFSEQISGASVKAIGFSLSEGTVSEASVGNQGDSVYLDVTGVTSDEFTVTASGVKDLAGNAMAGSQTTKVKVSGWQAADEGVFVDPDNRPQRGDDPGIVGSSTFLSSGDNVEIDYVGGGYNNFNGDRNHFVYKAVSGDFDWAVECTRYDKTDQLGGWGNGGLTVASGAYATKDLDGNDIVPNTDAATRAARYSAITYCFGSANGNHRALNTWRDAPKGGQGNNGGPGFGTPDVNGFVGKYGTYTRFVNSAGEALANTRPDQNPWLRLVRKGTKVTAYWSLFGNVWQLIDGDGRDMPNIPNDAVIGWMCMTDAGGYGNQQPNHYVTLNLRNFGPYASLLDVLIAPTVDGTTVSFKGGKLQSAPTVDGPWTDVAGGNLSPITVTASGESKFFRVAGN